MVEKVVMSSRNASSRNVIDFRAYRLERQAGTKARAMSAKGCRHCGAALLDGESDDDCSSAGAAMAAPSRRFYVE